MNRSLDEEYGALHAAVVWTDRGLRDARIEVRGPDAVDWLQGLLTQDVAALQPGQVADAAYLTPQGRMVAELRIVRREDGFLLETPMSARDAVLGRLDQFIIMEDVTLTDASERLGCLTVLGPDAPALVDRLTSDGDASPSDDLRLPNDAFGVAGVDLIASTARVAEWRTTLASLAPEASDRLLETARIEAGRPRYGVDMHDDTIPLEAGLESRAISFDKGCYVGQEIVIRILHRGQGRVARRLVWLEGPQATDHDAVWPVGTPVSLGEKSVGAITSACWSPARGAVLGIAMLHRDATDAGTIVSVAGTPATVSRLP